MTKFTRLLFLCGLIVATSGCTKPSCSVKDGQDVLSNFKEAQGITVLSASAVGSSLCQIVAKLPNGQVSQMAYTSDRKYLVPGAVLDASTKTALSRDVIWKYQRADGGTYKKLESMASLTFGTGSTHFVVIGDPECSFCEKLLSSLTTEDLKKYTIHYVLFPLQMHILGQVAAYQLECSEHKADLKSRITTPDKLRLAVQDASALIKANGNKMPSEDVCQSLKASVTSVRDLLTQNKIPVSTPILVRSDETWEAGALPHEMLQQFLR